MAETPTRPRGTRDFSQEEMSKRRYVLEIIRTVYESYGYGEIETPALEKWEVLAAKSGGGEAINKSIFRFEDYGGRMLGLRFDLSVPTSRYLANNPNLPKPFKRCQIGRVWRYEEPQAGRYREFWQADVDIFGSTETEADVDTVSAVVDALKALGFKEVIVKINNRKLLEDIIDFFGISREKAPDLFRSIDKLEKQGKAVVEKELEEKGFTSVDELLTFLEMRMKPEEILGVLETKLKAKENIETVRKFVKLSKKFGYYDNIIFDLSLARGLDYYTGMVFEIKIKGMENFGSVAGGGRFDGLIGLYGDETLPATGLSIGVERVIDIMKKEDMFDVPKSSVKVFVVPIGETLDYSIDVVQKLRRSGIPADIDLMKRKLSKLLEYASKFEIPYCALIGEKEAKAKKVTLRDMKSGDQELLSVEELLKTLSSGKDTQKER